VGAAVVVLADAVGAAVVVLADAVGAAVVVLADAVGAAVVVLADAVGAAVVVVLAFVVWSGICTCANACAWVQVHGWFTCSELVTCKCRVQRGMWRSAQGSISCETRDETRLCKWARRKLSPIPTRKKCKQKMQEGSNALHICSALTVVVVVEMFDVDNVALAVMTSAKVVMERAAIMR
jgi:predicted nucleic acid-binding Zn finger protein